MEAIVHIEVYQARRAENQALREALQLAREALRLARQETALARERLARLEDELAGLKRLLFGSKSERFVLSSRAGGSRRAASTKQQTSAAPGEPVRQGVEAAPARKKPVRQVLPSHLEREVIVIEPQEDASRLKKIGEEVTETLAYRPAKLVVLRRVRPKYVDPRDETRGVIMAALPVPPIEKGLAEPSLLAHVVVEKYARVTLYRQVQRFTRAGITLSDPGRLDRSDGGFALAALRGPG